MKDQYSIIKALHKEASSLIETIEELERDKEFLFQRKMEEEKKVRELTAKVDELADALIIVRSESCAWKAKAESVLNTTV